MKMKHILFALGTMALLASCGGGNNSSSQPTPSSNPSSNPSSSQAEPSSEPASQPGSEESSEDAPVEPEGLDHYADATNIVVWADKSEHETIVALVNQYNKDNEAHIGITLKSISESSAGTELLKDPKGKNYPSLLAVADDQISSLIEARAVVALPNAMQAAVRENDSDVAVTSVEYDGKIVAFPVQADNGYFLYYDGDVLGEDDVDKMEDLIAAANQNKMQILYDIANGWYANSIFHAQGVCGTESLLWKTNDEGKKIYDISWDNEKGVEAASYFAQLVAPEYADKTMITGSNAELESGFKDGTLCAGISGTWEFEVLDGLVDNLKARRLPTFTDKNGEHQMGSFTGTKAYVVNNFATAEEQRAAYLLGNYLTSKDAQLLRYKNRGALPCNKEAMADEAYTKSVNIAAAALQDQNQYAAIQSKATEGRYWNVGKAIGQSLQTNQTGEGTWADFLKEQCDILRTAPLD